MFRMPGPWLHRGYLRKLFTAWLPRKEPGERGHRLTDGHRPPSATLRARRAARRTRRAWRTSAEPSLTRWIAPRRRPRSPTYALLDLHDRKVPVHHVPRDVPDGDLADARLGGPVMGVAVEDGVRPVCADGA